MRINLAAFSERVLFVIAVVSSLVLFVSCFTLVKTQYEVRMLTVEKERAERVRHALLDEASQLALDQSRAALPKYVTERAAALGYVNADVSNTVMIEVPADEIRQIRLEVNKCCFALWTCCK